MAYRENELGFQVKLMPKRASRVILAALRVAGGELEAAAPALGVSRRTLDRYVRELGIGKQVLALRPEGRKSKPRHKAA